MTGSSPVPGICFKDILIFEKDHGTPMLFFRPLLTRPGWNSLSRIDTPVRGLVILKRNNWSKRQSTYVAFIRLKVKSGIYRLWMHKYGNRSSVGRSTRLFSGMTVSRIVYCRSILRGLYVCKIVIYTGFRHQVRLLLKHLGSPIIGDLLYGGASWLNNQALALSGVEVIIGREAKGLSLQIDVSTKMLSWMIDQFRQYLKTLKSSIYSE